MSEPTNKKTAESNVTQTRRSIITKRDLYKFHKNHIDNLHKKYSKITDTKVKSDNVRLNLNVHKIDNNIFETKMATGGEWPELKQISDAKKHKLEMFNASENESDMEVQCDDFEKPKKTAKPTGAIPKQTQLPITNKYGVLINAPDEPTVPQQKIVKKQWVPPIIVNTQINDYKKFIENITKTLGHQDFSVKLNRKTTKIMVKNAADHQKIIQDLQTTKLECHTFPLQEQRTKKIVLKAAPGLDTAELNNTLKDNNIQANEIIPLKGKSTSHSYLVTVPKTQQINEIKNIHNMCNLKVTWEKYSRKNDYTQCYRCQNFGHGQANCFNKPRCVKCPAQHHYRDCDIERTTTSVAYCCNCGGPHTANYSQCPKLIEYLENRNKMLNNNINNRQQNTRISLPATGQTRNNQNNRVRTGTSYATATRNDHEHSSDSLTSLLALLGDNNETQEIIKLINLIVNLKNQIKSASTQLEKITIIAKMLDQIN